MLIMKWLNAVFVVLICFSLGSCCLIFNKNCDDCDKVEEGIELADLILNNFESEVTQSEEGTTAFNIIHTVLNIARGFECPEEVESAVGHMDMLEMVFSSTGNFDDAVVVGTREAQITEETRPDSEYQVTSEVVFEQDGFYLIRNAIDNENDVPERDETNNGNSNTPRSPVLSQSFYEGEVIYVSKDMTSKTKTDNTKNSRYISSWKVNVTYL